MTTMERAIGRSTKRKSSSSAADTIEVSIGKGKAPVRTSPESDDDDVEEYEIEDDIREDDYEEDLLDDDDVKSVITLSSESPVPEAADATPSDRPWRTFGHELRRQWEIMYSNVTMHAINGNWEITEDYQREKDIEMLRYMEDYPLKDWLIPQEEAANAYYRLLERTRWRSMGIRIYGRERIPEFMPGSMNPPHGPQGMNMPPRQPQPPMRNGPPGPPPGPPPGHQQFPQHMPGPPPPPQHMQHQMSLPHHPPPNGILPSQPYAQPMYGPPQGFGRPVGVPQQMPYGMPYGYPGPPMPPQGVFAADGGQKPRRGRDKKETPIASTPPPPPPTPPYEVRQKPSDNRKPATTKPTRRPARRQAEAEEFPWTRKLDFAKEKSNAKWDDGIYDPKTLEAMEDTRTRNVPVIDEIDAKLQEQQRQARAAKKNRQKTGDGSSDVENEKKERKKRGGQPKGETGGDPYHSGAYAFASDEDEKTAKAMGFPTPDDAIEAGDNGKIDVDELAKIMICWNPGKKGMTENLEQAKFSVRDNVLTRKQLENTPILIRRAAECIVDFCPDLLWRGMLLRITSEGGYGNKDVRDRFCYNGCYCDKATITKRISAALGQKQVQPKSKGYQDGELEWYEENVKDFTHYIEYFGKRTSHRNMLKIQIAGEKRRAKQAELSGGAKDPADGSSDEEEGGAGPKRAKAEGGGAATSEADGGDIEDGNESGEDSDDSNAVSLQDSDILDKIEDD